MTFAQDDKVTVIVNPQCHGTVLDSDDKETKVMLDNLNVTVLFFNSELKIRKEE